MIEQAFHALTPGGHFIVLSPFENDSVLPQALKKVFGRVHVPPDSGNAVFWCRREGDRPKRRHEMTFQVRANETTSLRFVSRPGVFSYGCFDHGARSLVETAEINPGDRIVDLGCGCGTNGILAAQRAGPDGFIAFVDSNVRALANGFKTRPVAVTLADTMEWYKKQPADKQAELLSIWKEKKDGSGYDMVTVPWSTYLKREKEVLAAWHVGS